MNHENKCIENSANNGYLVIIDIHTIIPYPRLLPLNANHGRCSLDCCCRSHQGDCYWCYLICSNKWVMIMYCDWRHGTVIETYLYYHQYLEVISVVGKKEAWKDLFSPLLVENFHLTISIHLRPWAFLALEIYYYRSLLLIVCLKYHVRWNH